jgi:transmembrane sensor
MRAGLCLRKTLRPQLTAFALNMDDRYPDFHKYTSQNLAADESFQNYALRKNTADIEFWEDFIRKHPERQRDFEEAIELLALLDFRKARMAPDKQGEFDRLLSAIATTGRPVARGRRTLHYMGYRIAASLAGILLLVSAVYYSATKLFGGESITYESGYGQNITCELPDGSTAILNGNSKLVYKVNRDSRNIREVWLEGEAFFDVVHKGNSEADRFIVHIPQMTVEVLGTQFNVFNRDDKANIVLNSGKVKLNIITSVDTSTVVMDPEEAVEYSRTDHKLVRKQVNAETLTSWRNKVWVFENTPLDKIAEMIEYNFGVQTSFGADVDPHEQLAGTVPSENLDVLLAVLSKTSNLHVVRNGSRILITKHNPSLIQP